MIVIGCLCIGIKQYRAEAGYGCTLGVCFLRSCHHCAFENTHSLRVLVREVADGRTRKPLRPLAVLPVHRRINNGLSTHSYTA